MTGAGALIGGRFALRELLGVGGSAAVFRADDLPSGEAVAVKIMHAHLARDDASLAAFLDEVRRVEGLEHPAIATPLASGLHESGGVRQGWIATELLRGGTLAEHVERHGRMLPHEAARALAGVVDALGIMHARGLVHRDISPTNLLLRHATGRDITGGEVCLVDFGLADAVGERSTAGDLLRSTSGDEVVGNVAYLSPEQALGERISAAGDLYQIGAVLHFLCTGRPPYERETAAQVAEAHAYAPPPIPSAIVPAARSIDRLVTRAMATSPADRHADAAALAGALAGIPTPPLERGVDDATATRILTAAPTRHAVHRARPQAATPPDARADDRAGSGRGGHRMAGVATIAIAAAVIGAAALAAGWSTPAAQTALIADSTASPSASPTADPSAIVTPSAIVSVTASPTPAVTSAPPSTTSSAVAVPAVSGTVDGARSGLSAVGLVVGAVRSTESSQPAGTVIGQSPAAGDLVATGTSVDLVVANGRTVVPEVANLDVPSAVAAIDAAGLSPLAPTAGPASIVIGASPEVGSIVDVGARVELRLAGGSPAPSPTTTGEPG